MPIPVALDYQAQAETVVAAPCAAVWRTVTNLSERPTLISWKPVSGTWPEETSVVQTVMDKGVIKMERNESVVRSIPDTRLLLKVDASAYSTLAYLDSQMAPVQGGCRLSISVIVASPLPDPAAKPDAIAALRASSVQGTQDVLNQVLKDYRRIIEAKPR